MQTPVWMLWKVPIHYVEEARIILGAKHGARMQKLDDAKAKLMPVWAMDPYEM